MRIGLYVHIPFCRQKCFYCDFASIAGNEALMEPYVDALCGEIRRWSASFVQDSIDTVYIGGGTPTVLPEKLLFKVAASLAEQFHLEQDVEWTVEANPGTVNLSTLKDLRSWGINRLSFGVQSFQDEILRRLGRVHTAAEAERAVCDAKQAGFDNISVDLMYGLPGQNRTGFRDSLSRAIALPIRHVSIYGLQVEEKTPLAGFLADGSMCLPPEQEEDQMYEMAVRRLPENGFQRYEISNFALVGFESRHNLRYWQYRPYLGLGAAAHSFLEPKRFWNAAPPEVYIDQMKRLGSAVAGEEVLPRRVKMEEFCFLALRQSTGIDIAEFEKRFSQEFLLLYGHTIGKLRAAGLVEQHAGRISLTPRGMKFGNQVFAEFLLSEEENI